MPQRPRIVATPGDAARPSPEVPPMLVLRRDRGEWIRVTHEATGDLMLIRVNQVWHRDNVPTVELAFDDEPRNFAIERAGCRRRRPETRPSPPPPPDPG